MNGASGPRMSMNPRQSMAPVRKPRPSVAGNAGLGRLSDSMEKLAVSQGNVRASVAGGRRTSLYNPRMSTTVNQTPYPPKDPRPLRDKQWQSNAIKTVCTFLVESGYPNPVSYKSLDRPSTKDYQEIFKFLYAQIDPFYVWGKIEEEAQSILKALKYPYADAITKNSLIAVGSPHAWPNLLGVLVWMVELVLVNDQINDSPGNAHGDFVFEEKREPEKIFYDFLVKEYERWFSTEGDDINCAALEDAFEKKNETVKKEYQRLVQEVEMLSEDWKQMHASEPPLAVAEKENTILKVDLKKFTDYCNHVESKKMKLVEVTAHLKEDLEDKEKELAQSTQERAQLQEIVDAQAISSADVDRMNMERDTLTKTLHTLTEKLEEVNKSVWEKEISMQKTLDSIDKWITTYNGSIYRLALLDSTVRQKDYELHFNVQGSRPDQMIVPDMNHVIKPLLNKKKSAYVTDIHKQQEIIYGCLETMDRLAEVVSEKMDELFGLECKIKSMNDQYNDEKENIGQTNNKLQNEIAHLEKEIIKITQENAQGLAQSEEEVNRKQEDYEKLQQQYQQDHMVRVRSLVAALEDLIRFRTEIEGMFNDVLAVTREEVHDLEAEMQRLQEMVSHD